MLSCRSFFFNMATALLSSFVLDLLLGCSSNWRCAYDHFSSNLQPLLVFGASSFEVILAGPSRHSTTGTLSSGTSGSRPLSLILQHERIWRRIRLCHFCTFIDIVAETAIVSFHTLPVGFPLPTISKNSLSTLFRPWILDYGVSFIISVSGAKILISYILLDTSGFSSWTIKFRPT